MAIEIIPAEQISLAEQAVLMTDAFTGYIGGSFAMDAAGLTRFLCAQGADICYSRFARTADRLAGFAYINRTTGVTRVAAMGVSQSARRSGVARELLKRIIAEARERGDEAVVLEVIEQNPPACELYRSAGFDVIDHLHGWRRAPGEPDDNRQNGMELTSVRLADAVTRPSAFEFPELPWQVSRHAAAKLPAVRAFRLVDATVVISDPAIAGSIRVHGLFVPETPNKWTPLCKALKCVVRNFRDREFFAPAVFPAKFGDEIFAPLGFAQEKISQFLMRYPLL